MAETATASPTPEAAPAATPATTPEPAAAAPATGTAEPSTSEAPAAPTAEAPGEAAPSEETFLSGDVKSLPPELRKHYDNMLRDYKKKTGEIADVRKKADFFDQLSKDQRVVEFVNKLSRGEQDAEKQLEKAKQEIELSDEEFEKGLSSKSEFLKMMSKVARESNADLQTKLEETRAQLMETKKAESIDAFAEQGHQDIYDLENYGFISYQFRVNPQMRLEDAYANAKQVHDDIYKKGFEKGRADLQASMQKKIAASTEKPTASPGAAYTGPDPKKLTAAEALAWARKGVVVPQR